MVLAGADVLEAAALLCGKEVEADNKVSFIESEDGEASLCVKEPLFGKTLKVPVSGVGSQEKLEADSGETFPILKFGRSFASSRSFKVHSNVPGLFLSFRLAYIKDIYPMNISLRVTMGCWKNEE